MHLCIPMLGHLLQYRDPHHHHGLETASVSLAAPADDLGNLHHHPTTMKH